MSFRGGRGGRRGGGLGGRSGPMTEEERNAGHFAFPTETYPKTNVPIPTKASREERLGAAHFLKFRAEVREGPLFTGSLTPTSANGSGSKHQHNGGERRRKMVVVEIEDSTNGALNDGIKRYTDKYHKKRKVGRSVDEHPYVIDFFPKELYDAMGVVDVSGEEDNGDDEQGNGDASLKKSSKKKQRFAAKKLDITKFTAELLKTSVDDEDGLNGGANLDDDEEQARKQAIENLKAQGGKEDDDDEKSAASDLGEDDLEDEFEEDDDDDYNAEKYFDDGEGGDDDDGNDEAAY